MLGDPVKEAAALGKRLGEIKSRRSRYQEMAATGLIDFDELRERLAAIEDERRDTELTLEASRHRTEHLEQNPRVLLEEYAGAMPEKPADLPPKNGTECTG